MLSKRLDRNRYRAADLAASILGVSVIAAASAGPLALMKLLPAAPLSGTSSQLAQCFDKINWPTLLALPAASLLGILTAVLLLAAAGYPFQRLDQTISTNKPQAKPNLEQKR